MENATKALLIAAGMLIAVMILALMMIVYNQISSYYTAQHEEKEVQQLKEFNEIFENHNRDNIRGNDMISLMNRIIDYNERLADGEDYENNKKYPRMRVTIDIRGHINEFRYKYDTSDTIFIGKARSGEITNKLGADGTEDEWLISITEVENDLISEREYSQYNLNSAKLQRLSADVSNIMIDPAYETGDSAEAKNARKKREDLIENTLKQDIDEADIDNIKSIACEYYEVIQFKRALFNCTEVIYDEETGRIQEMNFVVKTNASGNVVFN